MKKSRNFPPTLLLLLVSLSFTCISCREEYDEKTYYKAKGEGYVFMCDSAGNILYPIEGATIQLQPAFDGYANADWLSFTVQPNTECYYSDINGMYQVHFLKRTHREDVVKYMFHVAYYPENAIVVPAKDFDIYVNAVENAQNNIIVFDTVKFNINEYRYREP